ncbi:unnamed protein product [Orchesella dallaii]|uniref:Uncharacterized protein n=1 Tax=Orchesella dallaii TaxID=48710 RepID=A0ABP1RB83_9HEXA
MNNSERTGRPALVLNTPSPQLINLNSNPEPGRSPVELIPLFEPENLNEDIVNYAFQSTHDDKSTPVSSASHRQRGAASNISCKKALVCNCVDSPLAADGNDPKTFENKPILDSDQITPLEFSLNSTPLRNQAEKLHNNIYGFEVLLGNTATRLIVPRKLEENRFILRSERQVIASALIDAVIERLGSSPSKLALEQLAKHLVLKYPALGDPRRTEKGWQMWFFHTVTGQGATGFLEDRLKNQRRRLTKKVYVDISECIEIEKLNWISEDEDENPSPDDSKLEYLRHNIGPDVPAVMKETVFMRRSLLRVFINEQFVGLQKAMQIMPRLFDTQNMIIQDFNVRHPAVALILYERWPKVSKLLLEYAKESGIGYKKKLDITRHRYDLTEVDIGLISFCLLPFILPSCGRKPNSDIEYADEGGSSSGKRSKQNLGNRKRQRTVKASDLDSLRKEHAHL